MNAPAQSQTIPAFLADTIARRGDEQALGFVRAGELHWRTWREVADEAALLAARIQDAGLVPGDRVAHVSENRYEWIITDLAIHLAGAVHVPIHITLSDEQIATQVADSGARLVVVSSAERAANFAGQLDKRTAVWIHDEQPIAVGGRLAGAQGQPQAIADADWHAANASDLATILYTSGTTGRPRGVMLSHGNLASNAAATAELFGAGPDQSRLCILPLSHIYARTCDLYTWVYVGAQLVLGETRETLARDCQLARPTALNAVPFLYQRIAEKLRGGGATDESAALREFFGGRMEWLTSGGAPLAPDVERWYADQGLPILAGYGLTESSPVISMSTPTSHRFGSVGRVLTDVDVRIADDGEILCRGQNVMLGYWRDDVATAAAMNDGWLHTGDLGHLDADGFLFIRGRKKELIVLSTGKKVVPTQVENLLTVSPLIEQAIVFGDGQPYLIALIVPSGCTPAARGLATSESFTAEISRCLQSAAHEEQVRQFALLDRPFSIERGEMTAKLSLCRNTIAKNFSQQIARLYEFASSGINHEGTKNTKQSVQS
ncbi:MAG: AMP-dependent synthetase/ligase [Planctomycetes bacterium]|nr:AMP-dependent synthetase/ligase [Planctomycetota bacterium]